jgi:class 3 adenylate cyclase
VDDSSRGGLTAAGLSCGSCGTRLPPNSKFCNECGTPVTQVSHSAEYKQVTVLFADVVHSMDIAAAVGPERLREIMAELVNVTASVVQRYGGTVDKFTGDGLMAVFGAPAALEDHAVRACLAALAVQEEAKPLAVEVQDRDGIELKLRVGLNSGQVIAGEIGSGPFGYTAVGEQVGMAQRMESVAPPGGVLLSAATARLVHGAAELGEPELVRLKGADKPVSAQRLLGMGGQQGAAGHVESDLVGRRWEMFAVEELLERAVDGHGAVVGFVGSPGIGKSRLVREVAAMGAAREVDVFTAFCESLTSQVPFHAVARLLRAAIGVESLDPPAARAQIRARAPDAEAEDLLLVDDLLGIADPDVELPKIDPDARRRRLTTLVNAASLARETPAIYVIEDAHWVDEVSESMLAEFLAVIPQTPSLVLVTYRPEYRGLLSGAPGAQTIALAPLTDPETATLVSQLVGPDPSVGGLAAMISEKAAGNPFFAEEMVRDLAERGVLRGNRGAYLSTADAGEVGVPATLQATIAARIDRLDPAAKRTLSAAAVIGARFSRGLLETLGIDPALADLVEGELVDQIRFTRQPEYVFHHPLIRTVAYEAQLKSDRAQMHRRLAAAIESRDPEAADQNAALIAEHLEAAGDGHAAYGWHMRAATWATNRDIVAARQSWERATTIADALPTEDPNRAAMRIAPRTMLCGNSWRIHAKISIARFEELRQLCAATGDKASLTIGTAGLVNEHMMRGRVREASSLASECMELIESIGDPVLTVGLSFLTILVKCETGEMTDALRWSQRVIDLADGDPTKGSIIIGSPLAVALSSRGLARWAQGRDGWRDDFDRALEIGRRTDPMSHAFAVNVIFSPAIPCGLLPSDDTALREIEKALTVAERSGDDMTRGSARMAMGLALIHRKSQTDRERGFKILTELREMCLHERFNLAELPVLDVYAAGQSARRSDDEGTVARIRKGVEDLFRSGQLGWSVATTGVLVETLLSRSADGDISEAETAIDRMAAIPFDTDTPGRDILLLRLRALLARARGDEDRYRDYWDRYRAMATELGFEGHMKWAEAMA